MVGVRSELGPTAAAVAFAVRQHRDRMGWGYARLSRELTKVGRDIPPLGLGRIESGTRRVDVDDLTALAVVFGVSPVSLLMPASPNDHPDGYVALTGTAVIPANRAWGWLTGSYPLNGSVLSFYNHALPPWERDVLEESLSARRDYAGVSAGGPTTSPSVGGSDGGSGSGAGSFTGSGSGGAGSDTGSSTGTSGGASAGTSSPCSSVSLSTTT